MKGRVTEASMVVSRGLKPLADLGIGPKGQWNLTSGPNWPDSFKTRVGPSDQCQCQPLQLVYFILLMGRRRFQRNRGKVDKTSEVMFIGRNHVHKKELWPIRGSH